MRKRIGLNGYSVREAVQLQRAAFIWGATRNAEINGTRVNTPVYEKEAERFYPFPDPTPEPPVPSPETPR